MAKLLFFGIISPGNLKNCGSDKKVLEKKVRFLRLHKVFGLKKVFFLKKHEIHDLWMMRFNKAMTIQDY